MSSRPSSSGRHRGGGSHRRRSASRNSIRFPTRKQLHHLYISKSRHNVPLFISLLVAIPVLTLLLFRNLLSRSTSQQPSISLSLSETHPHPPQLLPPPFVLDNSEQNHSLPSHAQLAPRRPVYTLVSPRNLLDSLNHSHDTTLLPRVHAVFVCETPCCVSTVYAATVTLVNQTLPPTHLTFLHSCPQSHHQAFHREARRGLEDQKTSATSFALRPEALFHFCPSQQLQSCALDYFAHLANSASTTYPHISLIMSDRILLEPTAIEKAWLSIHQRPNVNAIRLQAYDYSSLQQAEIHSDPLLIRAAWPQYNDTLTTPIVPLPLLYASSTYRVHTADSYSDNSSNANWLPFIRIVGEARMLREPLYTPSSAVMTFSTPIFSFGRFPRDALMPHLFSELAYIKWSARQDENDIYSSAIPSINNVDTNTIPHWPVRVKGKPHAMLVLPWLQMGGSEKCMLDITSDLIRRGWGITFVLTMPFWAEDPVGEIALRHEWINRALHLTSDVFDLLSIAPDQRASRVFRYLLESRHPEFVVLSNSRWAYSQVALIKTILPSTVLADYNHMIHSSWEGGGMPRFGSNNSAYFDLHLTASNNVERAMRRWIKPSIIEADPEKVQTCYIGTDASLLRSESELPSVRQSMREKFGFSKSAIIVLFAGRFVVDKGIDVVSEVVKYVAKDGVLSKKVAFIFVGSGNQKEILTSLPHNLPDSESTFVVVHPPATGLEELRDFYAMSDVFVLPSVNEGIALVVYEAMAEGLLVITTDVGGQRELVTPETGFLLPNFRSVAEMANHTVESLRKVIDNPEHFTVLRKNARDSVKANFTTSHFTKCVFDNLVRVAPKVEHDARNTLLSVDERVRLVRPKVARGLQVERYNGRWNRDVAPRSIEGMVTVGVKTYVCDSSIVNQVGNLVRSIRMHHPKVRVLLGNDGPTPLQGEPFVRDDPYTEEVNLPTDCGISYGRNRMVNLTTTRYFVLLDDDHVFDDTTNLKTVVNGLKMDGFDMVGLRVRNLPGIDEYERIGIVIPRYVGMINKLEGQDLTLCIWNENSGPSVYGITHPIKVDILHNSFLASTDVLRKHPWRNELKVNEHMTFFLDAKAANLSVGYLPSVFVHHRAREYSDCYYKVRFREDKFRKLLPYRDAFLWDVKCGNDFPNRVKRHILVNELDSS